MSRQHLLAVVAIGAVGVLAWDILRPQAEPDSPSAAPSGVPAESRAAPRAAALAPAGPLDVGRAPNILRPAAVSNAAATQLARDFGNALNYKALYDRLKGTAEGDTPEGQYFLYRILRACATVADRKGAAPARTQSAAQLEERRAQIAASLPEGDPRRVQRLEAFDKVTTDSCAGLSGVTVTEAELAQMLRNSIAGGDPKARAFQIEQEMWQERRAANVPGRGGPTLNDTQMASVRDAFSSRDPEAIAIAGRIMANSFRDVTVRIGPDQEAIENRAFLNATLLLACEYGYACGENNTRVLNACAFQGHCGVASLPDYLFYYGSSPYDAQLLDRYRTVLRQAVETGNWSAITIDRGTPSPNTPTTPYPRLPAGR